MASWFGPALKRDLMRRGPVQAYGCHVSFCHLGFLILSELLTGQGGAAAWTVPMQKSSCRPLLTGLLQSETTSKMRGQLMASGWSGALLTWRAFEAVQRASARKRTTHYWSLTGREDPPSVGDGRWRDFDSTINFRGGTWPSSRKFGCLNPAPETAACRAARSVLPFL